MGTGVLLTLWGTENKPPPPGVFLLAYATTYPSTTTTAPPLVWMWLRVASHSG